MWLRSFLPYHRCHSTICKLPLFGIQFLLPQLEGCLWHCVAACTQALLPSVQHTHAQLPGCLRPHGAGTGPVPPSTARSQSETLAWWWPRLTTCPTWAVLTASERPPFGWLLASACSQAHSSQNSADAEEHDRQACVPQPERSEATVVRAVCHWLQAGKELGVRRASSLSLTSLRVLLSLRRASSMSSSNDVFSGRQSQWWCLQFKGPHNVILVTAFLVDLHDTAFVIVAGGPWTTNCGPQRCIKYSPSLPFGCLCVFLHCFFRWSSFLCTLT